MARQNKAAQDHLASTNTSMYGVLVVCTYPLLHALGDRVATYDRQAPDSSGGPAKYREASGEVRF
jgi:hypothetical protein